MGPASRVSTGECWHRCPRLRRPCPSLNAPLGRLGMLRNCIFDPVPWTLSRKERWNVLCTEKMRSVRVCPVPCRWAQQCALRPGVPPPGDPRAEGSAIHRCTRPAPHAYDGVSAPGAPASRPLGTHVLRARPSTGAQGQRLTPMTESVHLAPRRPAPWGPTC